MVDYCELIDIKMRLLQIMEASGIADSGADVTLVDAVRNEVDDYWNDYILSIVRGTNSGESRKVTNFVQSTHTFTVSPAFTSAIDSTSQYMVSKENYDMELISIRDDVEAIIDTAIIGVGESTPLSATNDIIKTICADISAGKFVQRRSPTGEVNKFLELGNKLLENYIKANYGKGRLIRA